MKPVVACCIGLLYLTYAQVLVENGPYATPDLVINGSFTNGSEGWTVVPLGEVKDGQLCVTVPRNTAANASSIRTARNLTEVKNDEYYLNFTASASYDVNSWLQTQGQDPAAGGTPVDTNLNTADCLDSATAHNFTFPYFPANVGENAFLTIYLGGSDISTDVCIGNISLHRLPYYQDTGAAIKVNQLGFLLNGPKVATLFIQEATAVDWQLLDRFNTIVSNGQSIPRGTDASSRQNVHTIDFSSFSQEGSEYALTSDGATSY